MTINRRFLLQNDEIFVTKLFVKFHLTSLTTLNVTVYNSSSQEALL